MAKTTEEIDLSAYLEKEATDLQSRFAEWLMENVGYDPSKAKTKQEAFEEGVRLATAMRMIFQASPENREANAARKAAKAEEVEEEAPAPKAKKSAKATPAKKASKKAAAPVEEEEEPEEEAPAPKKAKAKKAAAVKKRKPASDDDEAPF